MDEEKQGKVAAFCSITGVDPERADFFLQASGYDTGVSCSLLIVLLFYNVIGPLFGRSFSAKLLVAVLQQIEIVPLLVDQHQEQPPLPTS